MDDNVLMETVLDYSSKGDIKGHLEIWKVFSDGSRELHFSEDNIITSGMGHTLRNLFASTATENVNNYQIQYFQLGVSGQSSQQVSSTGTLSGALATADYGTPNFVVEDRKLLAAGATTDAVFGVVPFAYIKRINPTTVMYQMFVGEDACNVPAETSLSLSEIGIFSRNPTLATPEASMLCAYRYFTGITKTSSFSLLFRSTIEF